MARNSVTLRAHRCDLSHCEFAKLVRERAPWFGAGFEKGLRRPGSEKEEWDFRFVQGIEQARAVMAYECAREVEWIYDFCAEWLALLILPNDSDRLRKAANDFKRRWDLHNKGWPLDRFPALFGLGWMEADFPIPLAKIPSQAWMLERKKSDGGAYVRPLSSGEYNQRFQSKGPLRADAIEIDWSFSNKKIARALSDWVRENRPTDLERPRTMRGKRTRRPFEQLKWLAASRLAAAGSSYKNALAILPTKQTSGQTVGINDPNGVLPIFASPGAWATAISKARGLISTLFPDPRGGES